MVTGDGPMAPALKGTYERVHHLIEKTTSPSTSGGETEIFSNPEDLAALADQWPGARLVEIWSGLPGVAPVQRFTSRRVAVARIWKAIQHLNPAAGKPAHVVASNKASAN